MVGKTSVLLKNCDALPGFKKPKLGGGLTPVHTVPFLGVVSSKEAANVLDSRISKRLE